MADNFVGEIRIVGFNFPPAGWAFCNGALLSISQNTALFALLGTQFGGDGRSTFGLPNLQGCAPLAQGQASGGSQYSMGQTGGVASVTLQTTEMPAHTHLATGLPTATNPTPLLSPAGNVWAVAGSRRTPSNFYATTPGTLATMNTQALLPIGGNLPHNNLAPYLALNFVIALQGIFPSRN